MGFKHNNGMACLLDEIGIHDTYPSHQFSTQTTSEKTGNAGSAPGSINQAPKSVGDKPARSRLPPSVFALSPCSDPPFVPKQSAITENSRRDVDLLSLN